MTEACPIPLASHTPAASWSIAGLLLEAIAARDFTKMARCFEPEATMRALLPRGPVEYHGAAEIVAAFRTWFGDAEGFEVLDATVGDVGMRIHASWRLRVRPTPRGDTRWHLIEQQTFAQAGERISSLDLLCSGFVPESHGG